TGGGFATRTLYENDEETIFAAQRPVMLNGIEDVGFRSDLLDRSLVVELPQIEGAARRPEAEFWREFEKARPLILGALLDSVSAAIRRLPGTKLDHYPRMADFALWSVAAEEALGLDPGTFEATYSANRDAASRTSLESSAVVASLRLNLMEQ